MPPSSRPSLTEPRAAVIRFPYKYRSGLAMRALLACAAAATGIGALAQEQPARSGTTTLLPSDLSGLALRGATASATQGLEPMSGPILPAAPDSALRNAPPRRVARSAVRPPRRPAAAAVRAPVKATVAADVTGSVQTPVVGLPDSALPDFTPSLRRRVPELDPYAPLGWRFGGLTLYPLIGQGIGYDTNPNRDFIRRGSTFAQTELELRAQSDWSRHELTAQLRGAYNDYPDLKEANRPEGAGRVNLRLDASRDTRIDIEGRYAIDTQRPGSPELNAVVRDRPLVLSEGVSVGATHLFNRFSIGLKGSIDRTDFDDAVLSSGTILSQKDRNFTQYAVQLRAGYELKPGFVPFVEGIADTRDYDRRIDDSGFRRSSDALSVRAGTTYELTRLITAEVAAGYQERSYEDTRLRELRGPLVDAAIVWAMTPLTTIRFNATSRLDETTVTGASGIATSRGTLEVQHDLRRNLSLIGSVTLADYDYRGAPIHERSFAATVRAEYRLTRQIALRASYTHEKLNSNVPSADYKADVFLVGLRLQP